MQKALLFSKQGCCLRRWGHLTRDFCLEPGVFCAQSDDRVGDNRRDQDNERAKAQQNERVAWARPLSALQYTANLAAKEQLLNVILIEQVEALAHLDEIVSVPGIDVASIAPGDLSVSVGYPGQRDHPEVLKVIAEIERKVLASNVALGGVAFSPEVANEKVRNGYRMVFLGADVTFLQRAVSAALDGVDRQIS